MESASHIRENETMTQEIEYKSYEYHMWHAVIYHTFSTDFPQTQTPLN